MTTARDSVLDELHALLDCVQTDGSISGLDECSHDSTLGQTLYGVLKSHGMMAGACISALALLKQNGVCDAIAPLAHFGPDEVNLVVDGLEAAIASATGKATIQ